MNIDKQYIPTVRKDQDSDYRVQFHDFLGCISAGEMIVQWYVKDMIEEAQIMATEALNGNIELMLEDLVNFE